MGKSLLIIFTIFIIILGVSYGFVTSERNKKNEIYKANKYYENYLNKTLSGTELATILGKAMEQNVGNRVSKDSNGLFIENDTNSIKIDLKMVTINKTFPMEVIYKNDISEFVRNFGDINFRCTNIEYHKKTGLISKVYFLEISE